MRIKILNNTYEIKEVECIEHGSSYYGLIKYITQEILLMKDLSPEQKLQTILHEILHSIFMQLGFVSENDNEKLIDSLATSLSQVLRNNQELLNNLLNSVNKIKQQEKRRKKNDKNK